MSAPAILVTHRPTSKTPPLAAHLRRALATLIRWRRRARGRRDLAALEDWQLADIGISRAAADREAATPFWRR